METVVAKDMVARQGTNTRVLSVVETPTDAAFVVVEDIVIARHDDTVCKEILLRDTEEYIEHSGCLDRLSFPPVCANKMGLRDGRRQRNSWEEWI